jgi:hypothetical protein
MVIYRFKEWSYLFQNKVQLSAVSIKIRIKRKHAKSTNFIYSSINKYEIVLEICMHSCYRVKVHKCLTLPFRVHFEAIKRP